MDRNLTCQDPANSPLSGVRILSLALNLPGPAALLRCRTMGADCMKLEPPSGDPMEVYCPAAYADLHVGIATETADLKSDSGRARLHELLAQADVFLTSFRPSAIERLGLGWDLLTERYPKLSHVAIVGDHGAKAEDPGHDLTYLAEHGLVCGLALPASLFADMSGALIASERVLSQVMLARSAAGGSSRGAYSEVALGGAAQWLALPRTWGLTLPDGSVGGAHAGYRVYRCSDGRVALAALEPHFARRLCEVVNLPPSDMLSPSVREALTGWFGQRNCAQVRALATMNDLPLLVLPDRGVE
ncbi:Crotonobetainyl-CoA:carnitine CoA-transferase CaiB [Variovorax sp. HW608]|uniref:CoA transferase n=1 Tax=Variovorax sp. HW608 TaxID=1034889 RepID=UPI000820072F|nr:CoA transferase [Variovorax sp. HW608]SCK09722.1 Crotonobetainyl-CoA:carnitine CoA-transferase CaiB [Variovorax sp. HW608]